eukprot:363145-Chlamydomonas_euryale.AAC.6
MGRREGGARSRDGDRDDEAPPADKGPASIGQQTSHIRNKLARSEMYAKLKHKHKVRAGKPPAWHAADAAAAAVAVAVAATGTEAAAAAVAAPPAIGACQHAFEHSCALSWARGRTNACFRLTRAAHVPPFALSRRRRRRSGRSVRRTRRLPRRKASNLLQSASQRFACVPAQPEPHCEDWVGCTSAFANVRWQPLGLHALMKMPVPAWLSRNPLTLADNREHA